MEPDATEPGATEPGATEPGATEPGAADSSAADRVRLAGDVLGVLTGRGQTLAVAESLTGGLLAATITGVPGASQAFRGGVAAYASDVKTSLLAVPDALVASVGVVSYDVARAMAEGVRERLASTYALSTTGVAGPDPQEGKPVGMVFVAVAGPGGTQAVELQLGGDRPVIRAATCLAALDLLRRRLDEDGHRAIRDC